MRLDNRFILLGLAIFAALASSGQTVFVQPMRYDHYAITQQASIGAGIVRVTAPSAYLEVGPTSGATKGLLGPRLTSTERDAISSPADGLLIYNTTTKKYQYYDGGASSWKDLGSGAVGGSGITQLGTSPWGLTKLNDSTYVVDSMKVLTKYQGEKFRDSLAALINLRMLKSDSLTAINPTGYVTGKILKDSAGGKVDTAKAVKIDTTGKATGKIPKWDAACGCFKMAEDSVGAGGSSGSGAFSKLEWFPGDENAPANGDTVLVHDSFPGKFLDVYRDGIKQPQVYNDTGFYRVNDSTIWVKPPFSSADKFWHIEARDSTAYTQLTLQAPSAGPPLLLDTYGSAAGAYSLRLLRTAYTGHAIKVRRSSDNTTLDIDYLSSGYLDTASMKTFVSTGTGYIDTWYDQSSNGYDLTQPTTGNQPVIIESGGTVYRQSGKVAVKFTAASSQWMSNSSLAASSTADAYVMQVFKSNSAGVGYAPMAMASNALTYQHGAATNKMYAYAGNVYADAADASTSNHITELVYDGGGATNADKLKYYTNGSAATISSYSSTVPTTISGTGIAIGRFYAVAAGYLDGAVSELIVWMNDKSASRSSIENNVNIFYSIH